MSKTVEFISRSVDAQIAEAEIPFRTVVQELQNARTVEGDRIKLRTITGNLVPIIFREIPLYKTVKGEQITKENLPVLVVGNHANPDEDISEVTASLTRRQELLIKIGQREFRRPFEFPGGILKVLFPFRKTEEIAVHVSREPVKSPNCLGLKIDPDGISAFPIKFQENFRVAFTDEGHIRDPRYEINRIEAARQDLFFRIIPLESIADPQAVEKLRKLLENDPREFYFELSNLVKYHPAIKEYPRKRPVNPNSEYRSHISKLETKFTDSNLNLTIDRFHIYLPDGTEYGREMTITLDPLYIPERMDEELDALIRAKDENQGGRLNLSLLQINKPETDGHQKKILEVKSWWSRRGEDRKFHVIKESANYFSQPEQLCRIISLVIKSLQTTVLTTPV